MKKFSILLLGICSLVQSVFAQTVTLTGRVTDKQKEPIFGIVILLMGASKGSTTDFDGKFKFNITEEQFKTGQLRVSGISYAQQIIPINGRTTFNIVMEEEAKTQKEVVVQGIAKAERKIYTVSNSTTIAFSDIKQAPTPSFTEALQGRAPGLQVTQSSGMPGSATNIRIRGTSSMSASSDPFVVVDGIPMITGSGGDGGGGIGGGLNLGYQTNALANINPNDIESIEVLKDAAACAKYGARGSNGVILVTTKKGKSGKSSFNLNYQRSYTDLSNRIDLLDGPGYLRVLDSAYFNTWRKNPANVTNKPSRDIYLAFPNVQYFNNEVAERTNTNWMDQLLRVGVMDELALSSSGGNAKTQYFVSGTYYNNKGVLIGNNFNRIGARFNLTNTASDRLQLGIRSYVGYTLNDQVPSGSSTDAQGGFGAAQLRSLPIFPVLKKDAAVNGIDPFSFNPYFNAYGDYSGTNIALTQNPAYSSYTEANFRNTTNLNATYKLGKFISYSLEYGIDFYSQVNKFYQSRFLRTTEIDRSKTMASTGDSRVFFNSQNVNNILNYSRNLDENQLLDLSFVHNYQTTISYNNGGRGEGLPNDETRSLSQVSRGLNPRSGNESQYTFNSYLGIANYKLHDRYLAQASLRYDGSSRLGEDNRYGFFPALGLGYIMSEEKFLKKYSWIDFMKVKGSVGETGNAAGIGNFQSLGLYSAGGVYALNPTIVPKQIANTGLRWEKAIQYDVSFDYGFFKERLSGSFGYFNKTGYDLLLNVPLPASSGLNSTYYINAGRLRNQGIEFELSTVNIEKKNFVWKTSGNITLLRNKLLDLGGLASNSLGSLDYVSLVGQQISTFYLAQWAGVDPATGDELIREVVKDNYQDPNSPYRYTGRLIHPVRLGQIDSNRVPIKDKLVMPKFYGGFTNKFTLFKNLEVSVFFTFSIGNYLLDQGERRQSYVSGSNTLRTNALNAWTTPGKVTNEPKRYYLNAPNIFNAARGDTVPANFWYNNDPMRLRNTTRFLHNGSYVRLRTISISYSFPEAICKRIRMKNLRVFASAQNLYVWTKFPGWDPEVVGNLSSSAERNLQAATTDLDFPQIKSYTFGLNVTF